jgi:4a-hydroxytetrahydrobiopterin dehydratase
MTDKLAEAELAAALAALNDWRYDTKIGAITRDFKFSDFSEAFGFMARVAFVANAANHHPDWSNSYDKVTITLSTHTAGGVTSKDIDLAQAIDALGHP